MHRQSLGSPSSKLHSHGGGIEAIEENHPEPDQVSMLTHHGEEKQDNNKSQKPHRSKYELSKFIHFIPILTLLCFLILYLSSHHTSLQGSRKSDDVARVLEIKKGDVLAIPSRRKLQGIGEFRLHRKIGDL